MLLEDIIYRRICRVEFVGLQGNRSETGLFSPTIFKDGESYSVLEHAIRLGFQNSGPESCMGRGRSPENGDLFKALCY